METSFRGEPLGLGSASCPTYGSTSMSQAFVCCVCQSHFFPNQKRYVKFPEPPNLSKRWGLKKAPKKARKRTQRFEVTAWQHDVMMKKRFLSERAPHPHFRTPISAELAKSMKHAIIKLLWRQMCTCKKMTCVELACLLWLFLSTCQLMAIPKSLSDFGQGSSSNHDSYSSPESSDSKTS